MFLKTEAKYPRGKGKVENPQALAEGTAFPGGRGAVMTREVRGHLADRSGEMLSILQRQGSPRKIIWSEMSVVPRLSHSELQEWHPWVLA